MRRVDFVYVKQAVVSLCHLKRSSQREDLKSLSLNEFLQWALSGVNHLCFRQKRLMLEKIALPVNLSFRNISSPFYTHIGSTLLC